MKKVLALAVMVALMMCTFFISAPVSYAIEILEKNGEHEEREVPDEPIVTPDPRAVALSVEGRVADYVENDELEDKGMVEIHWNSHAYALYGCSTASINYENPTSSNIGMVLKLAILDANMIRYFGTTYRTDEETLLLALKGYHALQNGIYLSIASFLVREGGVLEGYKDSDVVAFSKEELAKVLSERNFLGMTAEELFNLQEEDVFAFNELERLTLAQLGGYDFYNYYAVLGETGVIDPGYGIYDVDLRNLPNTQLILPQGEYKCIFVLNAYDRNKNELSKMFIHLPVTLSITENLPEGTQNEFGVALAVRN